MNWFKKILPIILLSCLGLGVLAYGVLIGYGYGHDPLATSTALLKLSLSPQVYAKIPTYHERYLVKRSQIHTFFQEMKLKERSDLQMGAMLKFDHPQGKRCAIHLKLNPWFMIYDFTSQRDCN